ncbi:hypothetical protein ACFOD9_07025 [Novosphingobium bradum]|uniref:Uncharacterized protein n=1 Tax=Novosphingobium bradum TaxID=1737444 RepID=A0ABV7IQY6_9SPHN
MAMHLNRAHARRQSVSAAPGFAANARSSRSIGCNPAPRGAWGVLAQARAAAQAGIAQDRENVARPASLRPLTKAFIVSALAITAWLIVLAPIWALHRLLN